MYNTESLSNWFSALEDLKVNKDRILNLNIYGDSITVGMGVGTDNDMTSKWCFGYAGQIREYFKNIFQDVSRGIIPASYFWTYSGAWSTCKINEPELIRRNFYKWKRSPDYGFMGGSKQTDAKNATTMLLFNGRRLDLFIEQDENGGTATVTIDGESKDPINCYNSTARPAKLSYTGLKAGDHTILITKSDDSKFIYILGAQEKNDAEYGVNVNSMALNGSKIRNIESQNLELMASHTLFPAELTIINLVTNSFFTDTISSFISKLNTIIKAIYGDVLIVSQGNILSSSRTTFNDGLIEYAEKNNIALIDLYTEMKGNSSYLADGVHPNIQGHEWESKKILSMILPDSMK